MSNKKKQINVTRKRCVYCLALKSDFPNRRFFCFPANKEMCEKWAAACNRPYLLHKSVQTLHSQYKVCSEHFQKSDFESIFRLKSTAIPCKSSDNNTPNSALIANLKNKLSLKLNPQQNTKNPSDETPAVSSPKQSPHITLLYETTEDETSAISSSLLCSTQNTKTSEGDTSAISSPLDSSQNTMMFETSEGKDCISVSSEVVLNSKDLFLNEKYCDVFIRIKELEFPAHRAILSAFSPVFETMCDVKEKGNDIIYIEDCDASAFLHFLCFVYCGETETIFQENVFSLFAIADKFDVQDLRTKCVKFINETLSVDTFCDTLTLALQHSESEIIQLATDFFTKNMQKIIVTDKWQSFLVKNPIQCNELFVKALIPNKNSNV